MNGWLVLLKLATYKDENAIINDTSENKYFFKDKKWREHAKKVMWIKIR